MRPNRANMAYFWCPITKVGHLRGCYHVINRCAESKTHSRILLLIRFKKCTNLYLAIDTYLGVLCLRLHCWVIIVGDSHFLGARGKEVER